MGLSRRKFTKEFKLAAVRRLEAGVSMAAVARGLEVSPNVLHRWQREFRQAPGNGFPGHGHRRRSEGQIAELERKIGRQTAGGQMTSDITRWEVIRWLGRFTTQKTASASFWTPP